MTHAKAAPRDILKFALPSALGIAIFLVPFKLAGDTNTLLGHVKEFLASAPFIDYHAVAAAIAAAAALLAITERFFKPRWILRSPALHESLEGGPLWFTARVLSFPIALAALLTQPAEFSGIWADFIRIAIFMTEHVAPRLVILALLMAFFAPLIMDFGLVQFIAVYAGPIMRPLFRLPGRSAVDCAASWLGSSSMAVAFTAKMYDAGFYTAREAAAVICSFSLAGIYNIYTLAELVNIEYAFGAILAVVYSAMFLLAMLLPRIWPLSSIPDEYYKGQSSHHIVHPQPKYGCTLFEWALLRGAMRARHVTLKVYFSENISILCTLLLGTLPLMITFGTLMMLAAERTFITNLLAAPLAVVLRACGSAEAQSLASASVFAFVDQFLAAAYGMHLFTEGSRFICVCLSLIGLINLTEVGLHVMHSNVPLHIWQMTVVYIMRITLSLFIVLPAAQLLFP